LDNTIAARISGSSSTSGFGSSSAGCANAALTRVASLM
jgi:hypothetical protein